VEVSGRAYFPQLVSVRQLGGELQRVMQWRRFQSRRCLPGMLCPAYFSPSLFFKVILMCSW